MAIIATYNGVEGMSTFVGNIASSFISDIKTDNRSIHSYAGSDFLSELSNNTQDEITLSECSYEILDKEEQSYSDKFSVLNKRSPSADAMSVLENKTSTKDLSVLNSFSDPLINASKLASGGIFKFL